MGGKLKQMELSGQFHVSASFSPEGRIKCTRLIGGRISSDRFQLGMEEVVISLPGV
jgi:hypothetical protein